MEVSSCINCNCDFTSSEPKIDIICMTDQDRRVKEMPVIDILSEIYRLDLIDCLFIESEEEEESSFCCDNTNQNSGSSGPSSSSSPRKTKMMKAMCTSCFDKFKNLYEYYVEFNLIRHSASYLSKEIKKLDTFISQLGNQTTDPSSRRLIETNDGEKQQQQDHNNSSRQDESGVADCDMVILSDDEEDDQVDDDELTNLDKNTGTGSTQAIDPLFINPASNSNHPESFNDDSEGMDVCFPVFDNEEIRVLNEVVVVCEVNNAEQTPTDIPPPPTPCTSIISTETNIESSSSPSTSTATTQTTTAGPDDGDSLGATQNIVKIVSSSSSPSSSKIITKPPVKKRVANSSRGTNQAIIDNQQTTTTPRLELNKEVIVEFQCDTCFETFNLLEIFQQHVAAAHNHSTCQNSSSSSIEHVSSVRDNDNDQNEQQQQQGSSGSRPNETGIESISQPKQKIVSATSNQTTRFGHGHRVIVTYSTKASPAPGQLRRPAPAGGGGENATRNSVVHAGPQVTTGPGPSTSAGSAAQPNPTTTGEEAATTVILVTRPIRRRRRGLRRKRKRPSKAHFTQKSPYWTQDLLFPPPRAGVKVTALAHVPIPENGPPYECPHCLDLSTDQVTTFDLASAYEKHVKEEHFGLKNENLNADTDDPAAADGVESIGISDDDEMSDNERAERDSQNTVTTIFSKTGLSYTFKDCPPFQCPYCDLRGGTLDVIRNHIKGHHFNLDLTCATCFEVFLSRTDLSNHLTDCIPPERGGGSSRSNRNQSSSTGGADDGQLFICEFCGKECLKSVYLKKHKQRVHGDDNAFPCTVCRKSFRTRTYLSRHMDCHVESRDFICHQCGNGFKSSHHLRMHVRRVHR